MGWWDNTWKEITSGGNAPRNATIAGEPHMLAYINEAERQMLKRAGGAEIPSFAGIPAYPPSSQSGAGANVGPSSSRKNETSAQRRRRKKRQREAAEAAQAAAAYEAQREADAAAAKENNILQTLVNLVTPDDGKEYVGGQLVDNSANQELAKTLGGTGVMNIGGKVRPAAPFDAGNPPMIRVNADGTRELLGGLDASKAPAMARNANGSLYQPTDNPVNIANTLGLAEFLNSGGTDSSSFVNVSGNDGSAGTVTYSTQGGNGNNSVVIPGPVGPINTINPDGEYTPGGGSDGVVIPGEEPPFDGGGGSGGGGGGNEITGPTDEELAAAEAEKARQAALDAALGRLSSAFGFANDDYFGGLGTSYREGGLSEAFSTAYDDALRGVYDTYKSAGMLAQSDVDDDLGLLSGAESGEGNRLDNIVNQYVTANRNFVDSGKSSIENQLRGFGTAEEIEAFDIPSAVQPYKTPKEQEVVDFFTDFVKRSYDPSYNVDPTAVASGGPRRVSQSVNEKGANTAPSTIAGIFDPISGGSVKVVN